MDRYPVYNQSIANPPVPARCGRRLHGAHARASGIGAMIVATLMIAAPATVWAEFEVSLFTGAQSAHSSNVTGNDPTGVGPFSFDASWDGNSMKAPPYYGVRMTWWQSEAWGAHFDFTHSKAYASDATLAATGFETLEFTDGLNNITLGASRRWLNHWGQFTPYLGAGVGFALPHVEVQTTPTAARTYGYQAAGPNVAWMAGVDYALSERWKLFGEYKGTYSWLDADLDGGGSLSTDIWTNALNLGVAVAF